MASRNQRKKRANKKNDVAARSEHARTGQPTRDQDGAARSHLPRSSTETKSALKTTELVAYVVTVLAIIMTALALDADGDGGRDPFGAESAIRYITYLTIGYMVARGLAKAGSWTTEVRDDADADDAPRTVAAGRDGDAHDDEPVVREHTEPAAHTEDVEHHQHADHTTGEHSHRHHDADDDSSPRTPDGDDTERVTATAATHHDGALVDRERDLQR